MGALTQEFRKRILDDMFTTADETAQPATFYLALSSTAPAAAEGGTGWNVTEPVDADVEGGTYAREVIDGWDPATLGEPVTIDNTLEENFQDLGNFTAAGVAIFDAATGGQCVAVHTFATPVTFQAGVVDPGSVAAGDFDISLGGAA